MLHNNINKIQIFFTVVTDATKFFKFRFKLILLITYIISYQSMLTQWYTYTAI